MFFQTSSDFCVAPDMYVTKMASQYGVVNQGMNQIHRVQFIWYWGFNMLPLLTWWILVICRGRLNCWSSSPFLASMLITVQQWDDIVLKRGAWSCSWTIKKKASKNYCHICGSVKRAIGFLLKRDRRLSNMSLFGNCPICPRDGMRVMEKTIMPRVRAVCVCEAECMREIRVVEKRIRGTIYFLYLSSFLGEKKIEDDS